MELTNVTIHAVLPIVSGSGTKEWKKKEFVINTGTTERPTKLCLSLWGDKAETRIVPTDTVSVKFDIESREYNGRWFTECRCWSIQVQERTYQAEPITKPTDTVTPEQDNLPF